MILIRGIKGEAYARKIEEGVVDCRDVLSTLLHPPVTGYEYSNYFEKNFVKVLVSSVNGDIKNLHDPRFLYSLLIDYYIPHIYLTYFHILNERSLEWLEKFDDNYQFIALNVKIDRITKTAIGNEFFGAPMTYVDSICELRQEDILGFYSACTCSLENLFTNKLEMTEAIQIYNTLSFPLLCREKNEKFTDLENEFRIIAYDCPRIQDGTRKQKPRQSTIWGKTGIAYEGILHAGSDSVFKSSLCAFSNPYKALSDILVEEQGMVTLSSQFKSINIYDISDDYRYLGGKSDCANYIKKMIRHKPKDIYINRTKLARYNRRDIPDAMYAPSYHKVDYSK